MDELATIETIRHPVTMTYQGVDVTDDYSWLENAASEETRRWTKAQQDRTTSYLAGLPGYADIQRRAQEIIGAASTSYVALKRGGLVFFALKHQPPKQQPFLVALDDVEDAGSERVIVDPNELDSSGATTIDWYSPSPDGRLVAVSLSSHGTEDGTLHLFEVSSGALVDVRIPRITMMGGSLAWRGDSGGFWYTRYPAPEERPEQDLVFFQEVWFHELGTIEDRRDLAGVFADERIAENVLSSSPDGRWVMDRVQRGDGGEWEVFVRPQDDGSWWQLASIEDRAVDAVFGRDEIFVLSRKDAPNGRVLRVALGSRLTVADASEIVPRSTLAIEGLAATNDRLWILEMDGGVSCLRAIELDGTPLPHVRLPSVCAIDAIVRVGDDRVAYSVETFVEPRGLVGRRRWRNVAAAHGADLVDAPRSVGARGSAHLRDVEGRDAGPDQPDRTPRCARWRPGACAVDRLWWIRPVLQGLVRPGTSALARAGLRPGRGEYPRRRRVRRRMASGRPTPHQAELLR